MGIFESTDLVPLWDQPPEFLPLRPPEAPTIGAMQQFGASRWW